MAIAAFKVVKTVGALPGTEYDVSGKAGYLSADTHDPSPENHAVAVPLLAPDPANYSFENWLRLEITSAPDNQVTNFKVWGPATRPNNDPNLTDLIGTSATYAQPTDSASSVATASIFDTHYSQGTALAVGGTLVNVGDQTDFIVTQRKVEFGALKGTVPTQTFMYQYDES